MAKVNTVKPPEETPREMEVLVCQMMHTIPFKESLDIVYTRLGKQNVHSKKSHPYHELRWFHKQNNFQITDNPLRNICRVETVPPEPVSEFRRVDKEYPKEYLAMQTKKIVTVDYICRKFVVVTNTKYPGEPDDFSVVNFFTLNLWVSREEEKWIEMHQSLARIAIPLREFYQKLGVDTEEEMRKYVLPAGNWTDLNPLNKV